LQIAKGEKSRSHGEVKQIAHGEKEGSINYKGGDVGDKGTFKR